MTFKHVKFEDSLVMRSLEKLAQEKGLIKPDKVTKTASAKTDLSPTTTLMGNIMTLCAGLRQSGYYKFAEELEAKLVNYKQAQTLYETSPEKGEDLVDRAHPKGSHKLEDVEGGELAIFETIIDQHLKNVKMIDKMPTGKLANSRDILGAVKTVFAQDAVTEQKAKVKEMTAILTRMVQLFGQQKDDGDMRVRTMIALQPLSRTLNRKLNAGVPVLDEDIANFNKEADSAKAQLQFVDPATYAEDKKLYPNQKLAQRFQNFEQWQVLDGLFGEWKAKAGELAGMVKGGLGNILAKFDKIWARLEGDRSLLKDEGFTDDDRKQGNAWIDYYQKSIKNWKTVFQGITDPDQQGEAAKKYTAKLDELSGKINEFEAKLRA